MYIPKKTHKPLKQTALALDRCLAKTWQKFPKKSVAGRTVEEHCRIAAAVAEELLKRCNISFPNHTDLLPSYAPLGALLHDVGKVCPTFEAKIYDAINPSVRKTMPEIANANPSLEEEWHGHPTVSAAAVSAYNLPEFLARIVGAHHGELFNEYRGANADRYGGQEWQKVRENLMARLLCGCTVPDVPPNGFVERMLCGFTTIADWIASGSLFDDPAQNWHDHVVQAVDAAGFCPINIKKNLSFEDVFSFAPRAVQQTFYEAVQGPGVYILEAPMGLGKTEAALYAAYRMLCEGWARGLYFALPTRLTSNRIHYRVNAFLKKILEAGRAEALLVHGAAWLERFEQQELGGEGAPNESWFAQGKRGILAPFAVGTIDQALLSALHVKHGPLRTFGLAGKVVILDEVHSYDIYTGTIMGQLIEQLRNLGCTVLLLSATLTAERRNALLGSDILEQAYPCVCAAPCDGAVRSIVCEKPKEVSVSIKHPETESLAVEEVLLRAEQGQRVLWIENTVREAQQRYLQLAGRAAAMDGVCVGLLHSHFTPHDRKKIEYTWTTFFAPQAEGRGEQGGIVVGTQVVEQSLDIDADFLVTRFCPTDMLLQRLGRLWRHSDTVRPSEALCEAWILHPPLKEAVMDPLTAFGASGQVYAPYVLARSLVCWCEQERISLPSQIRDLLNATYAEREEESAGMKEALAELRKTQKELYSKALTSTSTALETANDDTVSTRWEKFSTRSVLLLKSWHPESQSLVTADCEKLQLKLPTDSPRHQYKSRTAAVLARNVVTVQDYLAPEKCNLKFLEPWMYCEDGRLFVALVGEDEALTVPGGASRSRRLRYSTRLGYANEDDLSYHK